MSVNGPEDKQKDDTIEVALMSTKDKTAVTVQIYTANDEPLSYEEISSILFELAEAVESSRGGFLEEGTEDGMLN
jgi:hypothetical protein